MELDIKYDIDAGIDPLETIVVPEPDIIPNPFFAHRKIIDIHNNEIYPHELTVRKLL